MIDLPARYAKVINVLHGGGMSNTLLCEDSNLNRSVVVKSLKQGIEPHRLLDELTALSAIRSRYVVQVFDVIRSSASEVVGFVEEFLPGAALNPCTAGCSTDVTLKALYPIAAGVAEIHAHGRVHRDLKPDNMKFDAMGQLKIFDFGLAKLNSSPGTKALYFTSGYTAPEAFVKSPTGTHTFSPALDVYAFACVAMWIMNEGKLLPGFEDVPPTLPTSGVNFSTLNAGIAPAVAALLSEALAKNPAARPTMIQIRDLIGAEILRDKHRLILTFNDKEYFVDSIKKTAQLGSNGNSIAIAYDGTSFNITAIAGVVMINNAPARIGQNLTGSCVIVLGVEDKANGLRRASITCDVSHPEVTL